MKKVNWVNVLLYVYVAFVAWRIIGRNKPFVATVFYYYAKDLQAAALFFGEAGLGAESLYHDAMRRYSLAS